MNNLKKIINKLKNNIDRFRPDAITNGSIKYVNTPHRKKYKKHVRVHRLKKRKEVCFIYFGITK